MASGPLQGIRIVEFSGIGPGPYAAMLLSDLGADVIKVIRSDSLPPSSTDVHARGRRVVALNLKDPTDRDRAMELLRRADVCIEGFRPGVMERLQLGPAEARRANPRLVYGRITGWGQDGPLAHAAGHDINYIALTGALAGIGPAEGPPSPPLNLVGDFGGGSLFLVVGIVSALLERVRSGEGQVIDAAMVEGACSLMAFMTGAAASGFTNVMRGRNILDGSAHFYRCYRCSDGRWISVGAIEPHFYALLMDKLGIAPTARPTQDERDWARGAALLSTVFATRPLAAWCELLEGTDACVAPVLEFHEAAQHPQLQARRSFTEVGGLVQASPVPRFSRTPGAVQGASATEVTPVETVLESWSLRTA